MHVNLDGLSPVETELLYLALAAHEAGHVVMLSRYGCVCDADICISDSGEIEGAMTRVNLGRLNPFQRSAAAWGGLAAEYLQNHIIRPNAEVPKLTPNAARQWATVIWRDFPLSQISSLDRENISLAPDPILAGDWAVQCLSSPVGSSLVYEKARELCASFRDRHVAVGDEKGTAFPAPWRAFARQVVDAEGLTV